MAKKRAAPAKRKVGANKAVKRYSKGGLGIFSELPGSDLPSPDRPFTPYEIVLVRWSIDRSSDHHPSIWVDGGNSGVYGRDTLNNDRNCYLRHIDKFAKAVANDMLLLAPDHGLYPPPAAPDNIMNPFDFVIRRNCYVVFALQGPKWRFMRNRRALTTVREQQPPYKYVDLMHVVSKRRAPQPDVGSSTVCQVAYFSAFGNPEGVCMVDHTNMFFDYVPLHSPSRDYAYYPFDPAIKNDGHGGADVPPGVPVRPRRGR